jgi:pyridoxamine 5'-phosphate oxidase
MESSMDLEKRIVQLGLKFGAGKIPRPDFWSGFVVVPDYFEFWHDRSFRLHDRWQYYRDALVWKKEKLYP